jgi:membrane protein YdbS with pleckstrin-like domain
MIVLAFICLAIFVISLIILVAFDDHPSWDHIAKVTIISLVLGAVFLIIAAVQQDVQERNACEDIGGKYVVVDTHMTVVTTGKVSVPQEIDVYGCVMK